MIRQLEREPEKSLFFCFVFCPLLLTLNFTLLCYFLISVTPRDVQEMGKAEGYRIIPSTRQGIWTSDETGGC